MYQNRLSFCLCLTVLLSPGWLLAGARNNHLKTPKPTPTTDSKETTQAIEEPSTTEAVETSTSEPDSPPSPVETSESPLQSATPTNKADGNEEIEQTSPKADRGSTEGVTENQGILSKLGSQTDGGSSLQISTILQFLSLGLILTRAFVLAAWN